ncbi:MAG: hypothetical protein ACREMY_06085 [bacterium]
MGLFDRFAGHAFLSGKRARQFEVAAQQHAKAFWLLLIVGGIVWWLAGWEWALVPAALAAWTAFKSMSATMMRTRLEKLERETGMAQGDSPR